MMYCKNVFSLVLCMLMLSSCYRNNHQSGNNQSDDNQLTVTQEQLQLHGWKFVEPKGGELGEEYGVKPKFGIQDNYFDIQVGNGYNVAIKIVDISTDRCVRYVYVPQNETVTINEIPQGRYYLKLAYGNAWMELETEDGIQGKFTKNLLFERSAIAYDFGKKNSQDVVNYILQLNVINGSVENNFRTEEISEEEFLKN